MPFSTEELEKIKELREKGRSTREIAGFLGGSRLNRTSVVKQEEDYLKTAEGKTMLVGEMERAQDIQQAGSGMLREFKKAGEDIVDTATDSNLTLIDKVLGIGASSFRGSVRGLIDEPAKGLIKSQLSQPQEDSLKEGIMGFGQKVGETETAQAIVGWYNSKSTDTQRNINNALGFTEGLLELVGVGAAVSLTKRGFQKVIKFAEVVDKAEDVTTAGAKTVDDVIQAEAPKLEPDDFIDPNLREQARVRLEAEANAPKLTWQEKSIGLNQADKGQILGKTEKMQDYIDVVKTKNVKKDAPSAMEYGGDQVRKAVEVMETKLNETGSAIGQTRDKLATIKAPITSVGNIETAFKSELERLGLMVNDAGHVVRTKGVVSRVGTAADIKTLDTLWNEFKIVKQSPTLTNLLDYRNLVQKNIDFSKRAGEVSDALNSPAKRIRGVIKTEADTLVGKQGAADLLDYTNYITALNELRSFTERRAGGEYLLRVLESGRGGEAREVINTIKKYTGIDLQDDATMMKLVTDLIADADQKTLFRQQITSAGLDTARIMTGDPTTLIGRAGGFVLDKLTDAEKVLMDATGGQSFRSGAIPKIATKDIPNAEGGFIAIPRNSAQIKEILGQIKEGGTTFNLVKGKNLAGEKAFAVSVFPNRGQVIKGGDIKISDLRNFVEQNKDVLADERFALGGWMDEGDAYLDISTTVKTKEAAEQLGKEFNQIAVTDLEAIGRGDFDNAFINTGGTGEAIKGLSDSDVTRILQDVTSNTKAIEKPAGLADVGDNTIQSLTKEGNTTILDADRFKGFYRDFDPANHKTYSGIVNDLFDQKMVDPNVDTVVFTAGGSGSGKSEFITKELVSNKYDGVIFDGTFKDTNKSMSKISQALDAGKEVEVHVALADPERAWGFVKQRAAETGRDVPTDIFIDSHIGVRNTVKALLRTMGQEPNLKVKVLDLRKVNLGDDVPVISNNSKILEIIENENLSKESLLDIIK